MVAPISIKCYWETAWDDSPSKDMFSLSSFWFPSLSSESPNALGFSYWESKSSSWSSSLSKEVPGDRSSSESFPRRNNLEFKRCAVAEGDTKCC